MSVVGPFYPLSPPAASGGQLRQDACLQEASCLPPDCGRMRAGGAGRSQAPAPPAIVTSRQRQTGGPATRLSGPRPTRQARGLDGAAGWGCIRQTAGHSRAGVGTQRQGRVLLPLSEP